MFARGWWIAAAGGLIAVVLWSVLAMRGPAPGRAPVQRAGGQEETGTSAAGGGGVRVSVVVLPAGSRPEWVFEARDSAGGLHEERGGGERECVIASLPAGRARCSVRARGFTGETRRLEVEPGREITVVLTLHQFGSVSGVVRCEGAPVAGVLVRCAMPAESATIRTDLTPGDRATGMERTVETDSSGRYGFDGVPPGPGYTLVAADFDHPPARVGPIEVKAGEGTTADIAMMPGAHLAGRIVDFRGSPSPGATVNVLRQHLQRSVVSWEDEARARTDEDGRFVTPALAGPAVRMLKAWIVVDGVQQVIQHEALPPDRGTKDVGTLAPHPGIVQFEMEDGVGDAPAILTVAVNGDPPGVGQTVVLAGVALDRDGRIRMAGLPIGEGFYSVVSADNGALGDGQFRTTGSDMVVKVPPLKQREERPQPAEKLVVDVAETADPALLVLIADGSFVMWRQVEKETSEPVVETVSPGQYTLFVRAGDRFGQQEITQVAGQDMRISIVPDRIGRSVSVLVLDEGKPVPGATVRVQGFCRGSKGLRAPWAEAGSDGRALIRGLPPDVTAMTIMAFTKEGFGRGFTIDVGSTDQVTVDLAKFHHGD